MSNFTIEWIDRGREPREEPDPAYPLGIDLDASHGRTPACKTSLPWPAKRCGYYYVKCQVCSTNCLVTTAGRPDDPRSLTLPCRLEGSA